MIVIAATDGTQQHTTWHQATLDMTNCQQSPTRPEGMPSTRTRGNRYEGRRATYETAKAAIITQTQNTPAQNDTAFRLQSEPPPHRGVGVSTDVITNVPQPSTVQHSDAVVLRQQGTSAHPLEHQHYQATTAGYTGNVRALDPDYQPDIQRGQQQSPHLTDHLAGAGANLPVSHNTLAARPINADIGSTSFNPPTTTNVSASSNHPSMTSARSQISSFTPDQLTTYGSQMSSGDGLVPVSTGPTHLEVRSTWHALSPLHTSELVSGHHLLPMFPSALSSSLKPTEVGTGRGKETNKARIQSKILRGRCSFGMMQSFFTMRPLNPKYSPQTPAAASKSRNNFVTFSHYMAV